MIESIALSGELRREAKSCGCGVDAKDGRLMRNELQEVAYGTRRRDDGYLEAAVRVYQVSQLSDVLAAWQQRCGVGRTGDEARQDTRHQETA